MKIIHLSDTHVGALDNGTRLERIVDDILRLGAPENHVIVHTGDLIDTATQQAMQEGYLILSRLHNAGWRVLLCPGNHDYGNAARVDGVQAQQFREHFQSFIFGQQAPEFPVVHVVGSCAFIGLDSSEEELGFLARWGAEGHLGQAQLGRLNSILGRPPSLPRCLRGQARRGRPQWPEALVDLGNPTVQASERRPLFAAMHP